jgi:hypothetical protein
MARPKGSKDKVLRSNASPLRRELWATKEDDFMMPPTGAEEREPEDLASALKALRRDPEFIRSITDRAKQGKLSPAESRAVLALVGTDSSRA